eukprot:Unigene10405_Nuclearia_a/m.31787 Unigene10405_Nuclearia_a/g.31787  ORF Unigene10405_Nuclearia_a/g.31787 Unigene10405_Nuclearia_a/m.31787 type:complete len:303 (-) Unigene10405_Nuclearia_a:485-1393(-)
MAGSAPCPSPVAGPVALLPSPTSCSAASPPLGADGGAGRTAGAAAALAVGLALAALAAAAAAARSLRASESVANDTKGLATMHSSAKKRTKTRTECVVAGARSAMVSVGTSSSECTRRSCSPRTAQPSRMTSRFLSDVSQVAGCGSSSSSEFIVPGIPAPSGASAPTDAGVLRLASGTSKLPSAAVRRVQRQGRESGICSTIAAHASREADSGVTKNDHSVLGGLAWSISLTWLLTSCCGTTPSENVMDDAVTASTQTSRRFSSSIMRVANERPSPCCASCWSVSLTCSRSMNSAATSVMIR